MDAYVCRQNKTRLTQTDHRVKLAQIQSFVLVNTDISKRCYCIAQPQRSPSRKIVGIILFLQRVVNKPHKHCQRNVKKTQGRSGHSERPMGILSLNLLTYVISTIQLRQPHPQRVLLRAHHRFRRHFHLYPSVA